MDKAIKINKVVRLKQREIITTIKKWSYGPWTLNETFVDGKLKAQIFISNRPKQTHPFTYRAKSMGFDYLPNGLDKPTVIIEDPENFTDFDNCLCHWDGMDGWSWRLSSKYPLPTTKTFDYIGGITDANFDLDKVHKVVAAKPFVTQCEIEPIPYYNLTDSRTHGLKFTVNLDEKLIKKLFDKSKYRNKEFSFEGWCCDDSIDILGVKKYYKPDSD